jgi:phosphoglycerol transferase MdoB-like AlkP superfamily enzyme
MKASALFGVLLVAKVVVLMGHDIDVSPWTPIAYIWQDCLVALTFAAIELAVRREWIVTALYSFAVAYTAANVAVARVLSSPLTLTMMKAAGSALSDSIRHHATATNLGVVMVVLVAGAILPRFMSSRPTPRGLGWCAAVFSVVIVLGPTATARVETIGLHRNAIMAMVASSWPRSSANAAAVARRDLRERPFEHESRVAGLEHLKGAARGRNVVLVLLESTGASYLKPYGAGQDAMPHLTELARKSIIFESAYTVYPESIRTLYAVLNGRYPRGEGFEKAVRKQPSIADKLVEAGYHTALFHSGRFMYLGMNDVVRDRGFGVLEDAGEIGGQRESSFGVDESSTVRRMLSWIDSISDSQPFFMTYLPIAGHHPYDTPEQGPFPDKTESDRYLNALNYADSSLNELLDGLRKRGLDSHTLFVIAGDHGEAFGQHDGNYGHSQFIYDENVRVPFMIAAPRLIDSELRIQSAVSLIDTSPTILEMLGMEVPSGYEGSSMLDGVGRVSLFSTDYSINLLGLRDGCWKYVYEPGVQRSKLFNLCEDAEEKRDLATEYGARVAAYRARVVDWNSE